MLARRSLSSMGEMISGGGRLSIGGETVAVMFTVPKGACRPEAILPDVQRLADTVTDLAERRGTQAGRAVTCAKGCAACCQQVVPVSPAEARHLAAVVEALPQARAAAVRERFETVRRHMARAAPMPDPAEGKAGEAAFADAWRRERLDCPFLDEGACSIYAARPLVCREYLVTSPRAGCEAPGTAAIVPLTRAVSVTSVMISATAVEGQARWMPLTDALRYAEENPRPAPDRTGPQWVQGFLQELGRT